VQILRQQDRKLIHPEETIGIQQEVLTSKSVVPQVTRPAIAFAIFHALPTGS
jgi:hypothetical protein